jgi:flagellar biosynthesis protein FlhB
MVLFLMAVLDYAYTKWQHQQDLKMTKQEVKDEYKQREGDPSVKARIRSVQREMARRRMMEAVPEATVVITNPTHLAIALKYEEGMHAPTVVAKGAGFVAQKIKAIAAENDIPWWRTNRWPEPFSNQRKSAILFLQNYTVPSPKSLPMSYRLKGLVNN